MKYDVFKEPKRKKLMEKNNCRTNEFQLMKVKYLEYEYSKIVLIARSREILLLFVITYSISPPKLCSSYTVIALI